MKKLDLTPRDYRIVKSGRREPIFGPNWYLLVVYFVLFWILFGLHYVPQGSWISPIARALTGH